MTTKPKKKVVRTVTHDRLAVKAVYVTGGKFLFSITRSGEHLDWRGACDQPTNDTQAQLFLAWAKSRVGELNKDRIERVFTTARNANSMADLYNTILKDKA